ncbi:acetolactate decarboxylase [Mucilaginibacter sp. BJC16-A38]|uniref:acetolactate decarboxylase n=1 Tax=Mucilaginibacter phenanthrenivorans TaxID=1234842 RepID=UPI0021583ABE|nr:acetolactate decarboxylase [Mucilaginibacter phenanthrenivorans]MCR8561764.1 acetolactate decarboxylase [Mucilaginibacter phenanthrenivorans]
MKSFFKYCAIIFIVFLSIDFQAIAQKKKSDAQGNLFSAGYAAAFIGGLYDAWYPYSALKQHGDFGLGAPARLDGELIMLNGKLYKTEYTGKTIPVTAADSTPYAVVCFFHATKVYKPGKQLAKGQLFKYLDSVLTNQNGIYAIHINGNFKYVKTRAFPPVGQKPYLPLAAMLDKQRFFEFNSIKGDLVGYKLPAFMEGPHIAGYHFHFLSADKASGGHIIDFVADDVTVEVDVLSSYTMQLPQTPDFNNFDFKKDRKEEIKSVENGKKQ